MLVSPITHKPELRPTHEGHVLGVGTVPANGVVVVVSVVEVSVVLMGPAGAHSQIKSEVPGHD